MINQLRDQVAKYWWVLLVRGIFAVLFAVLAFTSPGITLATLVLLYGIYAFADGLMALFGGVSHKFWQSLLLGLVGIGAGLATIFYPGLTTIMLLYFIAAWAIVRGVFEIVVAIRIRKEVTGEWMLVLAGIASILFGFLILRNPGAGALAIVWILGAYALAFGIMLVIASFKVKGLARA